MANSWRGLFVLASLLAVGFLVSCSGSGGDDDDSGQGADDDHPSVDDNARDSAPVALVVTRDSLAEAWSVYADWKNRTGMRTDVVTLETALGANADDPFALRGYLKNAHSQGVRYVLLGGDADQIPYIRGYTEVWALDQYYGTAPIDTFYEELDADWDANGNGVYGEENEDITIENLRGVKLAVGRVPVETPDEVGGYVDKLIRYESGAGKVAERTTSPLFLADVASTIPGIGDIDGGITHEQLIKDYIPEEFQANMRRLYGTKDFADKVGAEVETKEKIFSAFEDEGYAFAVTNTHGSFSDLTNEMNIYRVPLMENEVPFVFITTSCLSGNFADEAYGNGDNDLQTGQDLVAEELVKNPDGGAVAYLGNTLIGLGPAGGVQFNNSVCREIFKEGHDILGDAIRGARATLYTETADGMFGTIPFSLPMDLFPGSEWYTLRSEILLGDPALRLWTHKPQVLAIEGQGGLIEGFNSIGVLVKRDGSPASNVRVTLDQVGGVLVEKQSDPQGKVVFNVELSSGDSVYLTASGRNLVPNQVEISVE